ncbi:MAG: tail protein X [Pseudomonadales bacterium]
MRYRTVQGDTLDLICHRHYGSAHRTTEQVMEANPQLAELGPVIPENTEIELPPITSTSPRTQRLQLWD